MPSEDVFKKQRSKKGPVPTCAVVGNGGGLLLAEKGEEIDQHDAVLRFNGGITKGFEKHVSPSLSSTAINTAVHLFPLHCPPDVNSCYTPGW